MREKLIEILLQKPNKCTFEQLADHLIANGVTVTDTNVGKWISVAERLPTKKDAEVMGGYLPAIQRCHKPTLWKWTDVANHPEYFTHWYALPEPPKGE